jgi:hypothetical protein
MVSLSKHCLEDLVNNGKIDMKERMETLQKELTVLSDQHSTVLKSSREDLAEKSRCT